MHAKRKQTVRSVSLSYPTWKKDWWAWAPPAQTIGPIPSYMRFQPWINPGRGPSKISSVKITKYNSKVGVIPKEGFARLLLTMDHVTFSYIHSLITNTQIQIALSIDKKRIWITILNRKPWLSRCGDKNDIRQTTLVRFDSSIKVPR